MADYIVQKGDSLWSIAQRKYGKGTEWPRIAAANKLKDPKIIVIGSTLKVPDNSAGPSGPPPPARVAAPAPVRSPTPPANYIGTILDFKPAVAVCYPPTFYDLEKTFQSIKQTTPYGSVTISLKGEMKFVLGKSLDFAKYDIGKQEVSGKVKAEYDSAFSKTVGEVGYKYVDGNVEVSSGISVEGKVGGKTFLCTKMDLKPPNKVVFKSEAEPLKGVQGNFHYTGKMYCEVEFELQPNRRTAEALYEILPTKEQVKIGVGVLVVAGAIILLAPELTIVGLFEAGVELISFMAVRANPSAYGF